MGMVLLSLVRHVIVVGILPLHAMASMTVVTEELVDLRQVLLIDVAMHRYVLLSRHLLSAI